MLQFPPLGLEIAEDDTDRNKYFSISLRNRHVNSSDVAEITLMSPGDILFLYTDGVHDGHSAGATAVQTYQAQTQDTRVAGVVLASGNVRPDSRVTPPEFVAQAKQMIADGRPEDLVQGPFVSAATFMDIVYTPPEFKDFFGVQTPNPGVTRIRCPLLVFFGTNEDVGNEEDLEILRSSIKRQRTGPSRVNTIMIQGADHLYAGQEDRVAQVIAGWADTLLAAKTETGEVSKTP